MTKTVVTLQDRLEQTSGRVFLTSMQALVRLPLDMARRDRAAGLKTGGYVTGYRGSPITTLDAQLWAAKILLDAHDIHFEPGLNEELAATSLRGAQQVHWFGKSRFEGVFAMWYAKGLGVDRACEALKLANFEGTHEKGGVLVVAGDDHAAKSSASAHQSEHTLIAGFLPILAPSTTEEIIAYGLLGWEMSRFSGLYVSLKAVTDTLDLTSSVTLPEISIVHPELPLGAQLNIRRSLPPLVQESLVVNERLPAAVQFARANGLNRVVIAPEQRNLVILTAGKAYLDVREALLALGLDEARCRVLGISLVKLGMTWPMDQDFLRSACAGAREVLVVEEKRPVIEEQLASALFAMPGARPTIVGKRDEQGRVLLPLDNVLDAGLVRRTIVSRLDGLGVLDAPTRAAGERLATMESAAIAPAGAVRPAYFCSGCPHNTSTNVPDGSLAMGATGCHGLAAFMPERRTMNVVGMGAEGLPWLGAQHFTETEHVFSNMGDGTYAHSGILAIRAALAAKTNVTFKILYNDAVAMTGGQPLEGNIQPDQIVAELIAEGVTPVVMVSDQPEKWAGKLPAEVRVLERDRLDALQRELREVKGVSAIIYEQTCANEKRRRRKRGNYPDPDMRLYINPAVCEGCGDCSRQSNCVSITPLETEFGRKRAIDQSNCNKDYSCVKGFCPSFVTVRGARIAKRAIDIGALEPLIARLRDPRIVDVSNSYAMLVTGIGGTGVLTVGAVLGMAAHIEGKAAKVLDMTGMAQKGGGVMSHIRFADDAERIPSARLGVGQADLLIACDLVVAAGPDVAKTVRADSHVIANEDVVPTGEFQTRKDLDFRAAAFVPAISRRVEGQNIALVRANALAAKLMGDTIFTNLLMVGYAAQTGLLPIGIDAITQAVRLNGTAVEANLLALTLGRIAAAFPDEMERFAQLDPALPEPENLPATVESRSRHLAGYQSENYAAQYRAFLDDVTARLSARKVEAAEPFLMAVAAQLSRLMSYKDEYEVARLYSAPEFKAGVAAQFDGDYKIEVNLAPPLLAFRKDLKTGRPRKIAMGRWIFPVFGLLARMKGLRGTPLDVFGMTAERRMERALIGEYRALILSVADRATQENLELCTEIADAAALVAGFGPVKEAGVAAYRKQLAELLARLETETAAPPHRQVAA
ncbi:indolepyruvate ferredoxin oxidoreductase family protein [Novosphingobium sp. 9U]|uniref:indolepyruvate ferredoxin oxidoreductase family protein n=1 Tax=Novosphingobium sp. 9U TaxID=2653158 RepID=UPI0012F328BB|nr:indolepyruvate ferredoxin oxidoreductase family protein [Novosphingobium sp. 9U]VWX54212.1 Indolepyruvate ferredoxin oxidoreductase, alpha and beta subunits [Novosphingobium sp. 9U]